MPSFVIVEKCDGCQSAPRTACQYICPNDLMVLDREKMKAYNQEPEMCWECYSCVKICPQQAIEVRGYVDFVPLGASVYPMRGTDSIMWTVKFRNGLIKRFKFPIRTTPEGSIDVYAGFPPADRSKLGDNTLFSEPDTLDGLELATPKK
ncbi:MAG: Adenylylsulfate reductase subunit beta [Candidatus Methanoperedenaceae archaeon GB37]|nr:adenylyl-sulfate reductase subunit beta [Candidatus Desulfofervidus sp.]MDL1966222.1 adenylyl-sulfate reductase subunit beta [Candidatus Desulfofervidus auxilii]CAD7771158.1 Adenylylsulfate reductase subunit beta [Candidatus Methanoperedenaceae archaeon GB37]CAD7779988.1 MAG: Adenylylsulfate reductase subunit beta [Candidatus Methanoperedenaceae archaeon GB37]